MFGKQFKQTSCENTRNATNANKSYEKETTNLKNATKIQRDKSKEKFKKK